MTPAVFLFTYLLLLSTDTPETAEESDDYVSEEEEETEDIKMPPKAKKPPMSTPKVPKKHSTTEFVDNHLGGTFQGMSLTPSYTVDSYTGYQLTQYVQGNKNILEVEICFGTYIRGEDGVKIEVSDDEMNLHVTKAMHKSFADRKRRQIQLGRKYHIDDVRMVAAENTLQKIKQNEESDGQGYFFGKPQVIPLPFKVLPDILKKKFHHHPIYTHQDRLGRQHIQFHSWYTLILESAERRRVENSPTFTSTYDYMPDDPPRVDSDEEQEDNQEGFDYDDDL